MSDFWIQAKLGNIFSITTGDKNEKQFCYPLKIITLTLHQAYNGTGSMSLEHVIVQSRIRLVAPLALYTH